MPASPTLIRKGANKVEVVFLVENKRMTFSFFLLDLGQQNGKNGKGGIRLIEAEICIAKRCGCGRRRMAEWWNGL